MRGCKGKCWRALKTFKGIQCTKNHHGKASVLMLGVLEEMLENIENTAKPYGKTMFINVEMLRKMLESSEILYNQ